MPIDTFIPSRAMAIVAHPDDIELGFAGTMAKWAIAGTEIAYVLVTSGDGGIPDLDLSRAAVSRIREAEQNAAAEIVGVRDVTYLREPDGMVEATMALRKTLVRQIRRFKPEVVVTGDPNVVFTVNGGINHPDHRAVATSAIDAVFPAAGQPHVFEELALEGLSARKVRKVYVTNRGEGATYVDITETVETKIRALLAHASQVGTFDKLDERIREWSGTIAERGREENADNSAAGAMRNAEAFRVLTVVADEEWSTILETEANTEAPPQERGM